MIRVMNLDSMFMPIPIVEVKYDKFIFPGGEIHIQLNNRIKYEEIEKVIITHRVNNSNDLIEVLMSVDALEQKGIRSFDLIMPYIPYARQDRVCADGDPFSLKVFADIINSQNFGEVIVLDAHSDVSTALINRCRNLPNFKFINQCTEDIGRNDLTLIAPDAGAAKKAHFVKLEVGRPRKRAPQPIECLRSDPIGRKFLNLVYCSKIRNQLTGKLSGFEVHHDDLREKPCVIVDDICDGGGTFIGLAKELKKHNAGDLYLCVTHGIFSKGFDELRKYFKRIYTTNSIQDFYVAIQNEKNKGIYHQDPNLKGWNNLITQFNINIQ